MYAKLDRIRVDLQKAIAKREEDDRKIKQLEDKLKQEEAVQIVNDVTSYNLSPEQLAQFLQLANSGQLQGLLNGQNSSTVNQSDAQTASSYYGANSAKGEDEEDEEEEDLFDENE